MDASEAAAGAGSPAEARSLFPDTMPMLPDADREQVILQLYAVDDQLVDPFASAKMPAPEGVQIMTRTSKGGVARKVAHINRVRGEPIAKTLARARPWFQALELPRGREIKFEIVTGGKDAPDVDAFVVEPDPIEVRVPHLEGVRAPDGDFPAVEVEWSEAGQRYLTQMTQQLVGREVAIVVADRVLWAPKLGRAFGEQPTATLAFVHDAKVAARLRHALRGDPEAAADLEGDRITDGGSLDDVLAAREAAKLPAPVLAADGAAQIEVATMSGERLKLTVAAPEGWASTTTEHEVIWRSGPLGPEIPSLLKIESGCAGECDEARLEAQIEDRIIELGEVPASFEAGGKTYRRTSTTILDTRDGRVRRWGRVVEHPDGTPPGLIFDRVEIWCFVRVSGLDRFIEVTLTGRPGERASLVELSRRTCGSITLRQ